MNAPFALFLAKKIRFLEIYDVIAGAMEAHKTIADPTLEPDSRGGAGDV